VEEPFRLAEEARRAFGIALVVAALTAGLSENGLMGLLRWRVGPVGGARFLDLLFEGRADTVVGAIRATSAA
jgi:hypothetical protein